MLISDITAPELPVLEDLSAECSLTAIAPSANDACAGTITATTSDPLAYSTQGSHVITWTFDDGNGNSVNVSQNVLISDITAPEIPVLEDLTAECSLTAIAPSANDACAGTITGITSDPLSYSDQGAYVIIWNFDDGNGNSMDVSQNVLISDLTAPTATCPDDVNSCDGSVASIGLTDVSDNCATPTITYELSGATTGSGSGDASAEIFAPGITTVTYTLDDGNGNSSQCTFTVTHQVVDEIIVEVSEGTLIVENPGSYQWISCEDMSVIEGETGSSLNPGVSGEYAVIVTQGECSATSQCYSLDYTGLEMNGIQDGIEVYPNPTQQFLNIKLGQEHTKLSIKVVNAAGQAVLVEEMDRASNTQLDLSRLETGIYLILFHSEQMDRIVRIMKE